MQEGGTFFGKIRQAWRIRERRRDGAWKPASFIAHAWSILWRKNAGRLFWKKDAGRLFWRKDAGWKIRGKGTGGYGGSRKQPRGLDRRERTGLAETAARTRQEGAWEGEGKERGQERAGDTIALKLPRKETRGNSRED